MVVKTIQLYHDSQQLRYRNPFGAIPTENAIRLRLDVQGNIKNVQVRFWQERVGETCLFMDKQENGVYSLSTIAPKPGCLWWYYFIVCLPDNRKVYYGNNEDLLGGVGMVYDQEPPAYQITVYRRGLTTPDWFKHAVIYQIFPDRFYNDEPHGRPRAKKAGAVIHSCWADEPYYFKDVDTKEMLAYDFFGGTLKGIKDKLPYLKDLGISVIYLNPIFKAQSNHRYDTGDYHEVDPLLGTKEIAADLFQAAAALGIRVLLDGVFSHTGSDSQYFNRYGHYNSLGAYQSQESPYYSWYQFTEYPHKYDCWWGVDVLPNVKEENPSYMDYIIRDKESVLHYWMKQGISGWRLDVLDELPREFSRNFYKELKKINHQAVVLGEVWEDASNKSSYGVQRQYFCEGETDSVMNYLLRKIMLDFALGQVDSERTHQEVMQVYEHYPKENFYAVMNLLSSHDVERSLTLLGEAPAGATMPAIQQATYRLSPEQRLLAVKRLHLLSLWQFTFPGVPSVYYGEEAGMEGHRDPYNRRTYPWGQEDKELQQWYKQIIALRNKHMALQTGDFIPVYHKGPVYAYIRTIREQKDVFGVAATNESLLIVLNRSTTVQTITIPVSGLLCGRVQSILTNPGEMIPILSGQLQLTVPALTGMLYAEAEVVKFTRSAGVLLHPSSLPSQAGVGDLGPGAYKFVDFLVAAGQEWWQVLPLNPVGYGYSPYQSPSAFAGNPLLISIAEACKVYGIPSSKIVRSTHHKASVAAVIKTKWEALYRLYEKVGTTLSPEYTAFQQDQKNWLEEYILFASLRQHFGKPWLDWPLLIKQHQVKAVDAYRKTLVAQIDFQRFLQFTFFQQWQQLRNYANQRGVRLIGDVPIFVAQDSADCWSQQYLFYLDPDGKPLTLAGVPPDYFSETGQLWGNPHYRWDLMKKDGYDWWRQRLSTLFGLVDVIRIDHFRGLESYWAVASDAPNAVHGEWKKGPGADFFVALANYFPDLPIIAEDLGVITDAVLDLKNEFQLPGMKIFQFHYTRTDDGQLHFITEQNCIAYTGTHDNNTIVGWLQENISPTERADLRRWSGCRESGTNTDLCEKLVEAVYRSSASIAIIPLQDLLNLGSAARMNTPGTVSEGNWQWQMDDGQLTDELAKKMRQWCRRYDR